MGERGDRWRLHSHQRFAALCELSLLQFGFQRSRYLRVVVCGWRIWPLLEGVWRRPGFVAVRCGFVALCSFCRMECRGRGAVGLGSVSLRKLDFFARARLGMGAVRIWLSRNAVAPGDGGIRACGKFRWIGSAASHG